jgi:acetolactate synthase-1/2/3 large subunit
LDVFQPYHDLKSLRAASQRRHVRWIDATLKRYTKELTSAQKTRFAARLGSRALDHDPNKD